MQKAIALVVRGPVIAAAPHRRLPCLGRAHVVDHRGHATRLPQQSWGPKAYWSGARASFETRPGYAAALLRMTSFFMPSRIIVILRSIRNGCVSKDARS